MGYESYVVLVIEDDPTYRKLLKRIVEERIGARCIDAANPIDAFQLFADTMPDLIIIDLLLPEMNGVTAVERLRKLDCTKNIPIVVCSSVTERETIKQLGKCGVKDFLLKPLQSILAVDKIKELLPPPKENIPPKADETAKAEEKEDVWV